MGRMTHAKFHFNWLMIFGIWASEPPPRQAWQTTEKPRPNRVKVISVVDPETFIVIPLLANLDWNSNQNGQESQIQNVASGT